MTHTLNRRGLSDAGAGEEIVVLCMAHRKEKTQKADAMKAVAEIVLKHHPDNVIGAPLGISEEQSIGLAATAGIITAVFNRREDVEDLVEEVRSKKLGISMVLSGLFKDVRSICAASGLKEHTYNISLGIFGKTEALPDEKCLEITTQCGHALISPKLVEDIVKKIRKGKMTSEEGAGLIVKPCVCGIVNPKRTSRILEELAVENQRTAS